VLRVSWQLLDLGHYINDGQAHRQWRGVCYHSDEYTHTRRCCLCCVWMVF
jgi:hypothetical protein